MLSSLRRKEKESPAAAAQANLLRPVNLTSSMSSENRSLLMRANRLFGASLVEHNLVKIEDLEKANERLLEIIASNQPRQATVLGVLAYEIKVIGEEDILQHLVETEGLGLVDLRSYDAPDEIKKADSTWMPVGPPGRCPSTRRRISCSSPRPALPEPPAVRFSYWEKRYNRTSLLGSRTTLEGVAELSSDRLLDSTRYKVVDPIGSAPR